MNRAILPIPWCDPSRDASYAYLKPTRIEQHCLRLTTRTPPQARRPAVQTSGRARQNLRQVRQRQRNLGSWRDGTASVRRLLHIRCYTNGAPVVAISRRYVPGGMGAVPDASAGATLPARLRLRHGCGLLSRVPAHLAEAARRNRFCRVYRTRPGSASSLTSLVR